MALNGEQNQQLNNHVGTVVGNDMGDRLLLLCSCGFDSLTLASIYYSFACLIKLQKIIIITKCVISKYIFINKTSTIFNLMG